NAIWVKIVEDITCSRAIVSAKSEDNVYFASALTGAFTFDDIQAEGPINFIVGDFYLTKINNNGRFAWMRETPGLGRFELGKRRFMHSNSNGDVYVVGKFNNEIDFENGSIIKSNGGIDAC